MKALILAAGLGSRLAPITDNCPKSLVKVNGKPILMKQIENLHENGITDITVVSGYKAENSLSPTAFVIAAEIAHTVLSICAMLTKVSPTVTELCISFDAQGTEW